MADVPIIVLAGQSNAALAGVDNRLFELLGATDGAFELVKTALGDTSLFAGAGPDWDPASGELFSDLVSDVKAALRHVLDQGHTPRVITLWIQGEADTGMPNRLHYEEQLTAFIEQYRERIGLPDSSFFLSLLQDEGRVRTAQIAVAEQLQSITLIDTKGLGYWDDLHYDKQARELIASKFFIASGVRPPLLPAYESLRDDVLIRTDGEIDVVVSPLFSDFTFIQGNKAARIESFSGDDDIRSGSGEDLIFTGGNHDRVMSGGGDDRVELGDHDDTAFGQGGDDFLMGRRGSDTLLGGNGNDVLHGGQGRDRMYGGAGDDSYVVDHIGDLVKEDGAAGLDNVRSDVSYRLGANLENLILAGSTAIDGTGNGMANRLAGNSKANVLDGKAGDDQLDGGGGADRMIGGLGDDLYLVDHERDLAVEEASGGSDTVKSKISYILAAEVENLLLTGGKSIDGVGNSLANAITGNGARNSLAGGSGDDLLNGGRGIDILSGGVGDDSYIVDNVHDAIVEQGRAGIDEVIATDDYRLPANVENLTLSGRGAVRAIGNDLANNILGNASANVIDGGAGVDIMTGGKGSDVYLADRAGDLVLEAEGAGIDSVRSSTSYSLGANVENLILLGGARTTGKGNGQANTITGNIGDNSLFGLGGDDILDGGAGTDVLEGGAGDDHYILRSSTDSVREAAGQGHDRVQSYANIILSEHVEELTLAGAARRGVGNSGANLINGSVGDNVLKGMDGADTLVGEGGDDELWGGGGDDRLVGRLGADRLVGEGGDDILRGAEGVDSLAGGDGRDRIEGGVGSDILSGGDGDDFMLGGDGLDSLAGDGGDDILDGGAGADVLEGGAGDDRYILRSPTDSVLEAAGQGHDSVQSYANIILSEHVEELTLAGAARRGAGNSGANLINGSVGDDVLKGMDGADTLVGERGSDGLSGGGGDDRLVGGLGADRLVGEGGDDILRGGEGLDSLAGGDGRDRIEGGVGSDILSGGGGDDFMLGGDGLDRLAGGGGRDHFLFFDGERNSVIGQSDIITDFSHADGDKIVLTAIDADTSLAGDQSFKLIGTAAFSGKAGELRWQVVRGISYLQGDTDGDGAADFHARLDGAVALQASDFLL